MTNSSIALARRFWMHVHKGGALTSHDVGRMVTALEDMDTAFSNLHREYERRGDTIAELETENAKLKQMWWDAGDVTDLAGTIADLKAERDALAEKLAMADRALLLTRRADDLREVYHRLPNDKSRIGDKRSKKSHARDAWLRAFRKAAKEARATLAELKGQGDE